MQYTLELSTLTWNKDAEGPHDLKKTSVARQVFQIFEPCFISRKEDLLKVLHYTEEPNDVLINVYKQNGFFLHLNKNITSNEGYIMIKSTSDDIRRQVLEVGDTLKLGKISLVVREINNCKQEKVSYFPDVKFRQIIKYIKEHSYYYLNSNDRLQEGECRICYESNGRGPHTLIQPCQCKGTIASIHIKCMRESMIQKIRQRVTKKVFQLKYPSLKCEICKGKYPEKILYNKMELNMIEYPKPAGPYIVLGCSANEKENLYIISGDQMNPVLIGRGHETDVKISDLSVSRVHCKLFYDADKDKFLIEDNHSKFGTFLKINKPIQMFEVMKSILNHQNQNITCQIGSTLLDFKVLEQSKS